MLTARAKVSDRMLIFGERHLRRSWPGTRAMTTDGTLIAAASSARPGPITRSQAPPRSGSSVGPSSAASSTNTNGPHKSPGQDQWPSSETPQVLQLVGENSACGYRRVHGELTRHDTPNEPPVVADRRLLRRVLRSRPLDLSSEAAEWLVSAGIR